MTLKASKSRKTPTLQQNTFKGLGSRTCRIGPVNLQNIKVAQKSGIELFCVLNISTFMTNTYSPVLIRFSCVIG